MANIMTKRGSLDNVVTYEHFCDTAADLANIPLNEITLGSVAVVLKDNNDELCIYLANSAKEWIPFSAGGSGSNTSLSDLLDISLTNPTDGQTLVYNSATERWENSDDERVIPIYTVNITNSNDNNVFTAVCNMSYEEVLAAIKAKKCHNCYVHRSDVPFETDISLRLTSYVDVDDFPVENNIVFELVDFSDIEYQNKVFFLRYILSHFQNRITCRIDERSIPYVLSEDDKQSIVQSVLNQIQAAEETNP